MRLGEDGLAERPHLADILRPPLLLVAERHLEEEDEPVVMQAEECTQHADVAKVGHVWDQVLKLVQPIHEPEE